MRGTALVMLIASVAVVGWRYPSDGCAPVPAEQIFSVPALEQFAIMSTGEVIPHSRVRQSGDGGYHICPGANGRWLLVPVGARS